MPEVSAASDIAPVVEFERVNEVWALAAKHSKKEGAAHAITE
jgi:hypothetical protein